MTDIYRTAAALPSCERCVGSSEVTISELTNWRIEGTVTMFRCRWCGYVTWDDRPGPNYHRTSAAAEAG